MSVARAVPYSAFLALSALFSITSSTPTNSSLNAPLQQRMEMPDSPPPPPSGPPPPSYWNFASNGLPVSYRVAIIIDAFVLVVTVTSLCLLGWYMRKQYRRRKLLVLIHTQEEDGDGKLRGLEDGVLLGGNGSDGMRRGGKGGKGKKGHVRWGSQVQGGSLELDVRPWEIDMQKAEPSTPSPTTKIHLQSQLQPPQNPNRESGGKGKNDTSHKLELDFSNMDRLRVSTTGSILKAKSSPMAKEFKGDPLGKGTDARVWDDEGKKEVHRKRSLSFLGHE